MFGRWSLSVCIATLQQLLGSYEFDSFILRVIVGNCTFWLGGHCLVSHIWSYKIKLFVANFTTENVRTLKKFVSGGIWA